MLSQEQQTYQSKFLYKRLHHLHHHKHYITFFQIHFVHSVNELISTERVLHHHATSTINFLSKDILNISSFLGSETISF